MQSLLFAKNGMSIFGRGLLIMLFTLPFIASAYGIAYFFPQQSTIPLDISIRYPLAAVLLISGILLWVSGVIQLLGAFYKGKLVTVGAYAFCRNPIYASFILFTIPSIAVFFQTWTILTISVGMWLGVVILIRKEEAMLQSVFGDAYAAYKHRTGRVFPRFK